MNSGNKIKILFSVLMIIFSSVSIISAGHNPNHNPPGQNRPEGVDGMDGEKGNKGEGLKDQYEVQFEGIIYEDSKSMISTYYIRDLNNQSHSIGLKYKYYFGKSYSEKVREDLQRQIDELKRLQQ